LKGMSATRTVELGTHAADDLVDVWAHYQAYRRRQAAALLSLVPREAIRPLYRQALGGSEAIDAMGEGDSLALLLSFCEKILPLPSFEVWLSDRRAHPAAHLDEAGTVPEERQAHVTVETRLLEGFGALWQAELDVRCDDGIWRGHVTFRSADGSRSHSTGEIFREDAADSVRDRFLEFDDHTLGAFLRSALP